MCTLVVEMLSLGRSLRVNHDNVSGELSLPVSVRTNTSGSCCRASSHTMSHLAGVEMPPRTFKVMALKPVSVGLLSPMMVWEGDVSMAVSRWLSLDNADKRNVEMVVDAVSMIASSPNAIAPGRHSSRRSGTR